MKISTLEKKAFKMAFVDNKTIETSKEIVSIKSVYLFLCVLFGIIGNLVVIIAIHKYKKLQTVPNYFVLNLAITDLLFAACGIPTIIITTIAKKWLLESFVCDLVGFLNSLFCTTSIWTLVMISINIFLNVAKANDIKIPYTKKRTNIIIISVWVFSALTSFPPLIGWSRFKSGSNFCNVDVKKSKEYSYFLGVIAYVLPMVFLTTLYLCILIMLNKHEKTKLKSNINSIEYSEQSENVSTFEQAPDSSVPQQARNETLNDKKVTIYFSKYKNKETTTADSKFPLIQNSFLEAEKKNRKASNGCYCNKFKANSSYKNANDFSVKLLFLLDTIFCCSIVPRLLQ
ncbi:melanopsin-B-like [Hydra vulgaris]|uniref:melanopsin-B-like n=1 Tax=Hydra vulgaris TaxID=6087 RepID=UPI001F5E55BC|nr:melanopsin-B-like [Hydra vulgaris]